MITLTKISMDPEDEEMNTIFQLNPQCISHDLSSILLFFSQSLCLNHSQFFIFLDFLFFFFWWHANWSYRCKIGCLQLPLFLWKHNMAPNKEHKRHPFCTLAFSKMMYNACCLYCLRCHDGNKMYITKTLLMQWLSEPNETTECKWKEWTIQWRTYSTISFIRIRLQNQVKNSSTWYMKREDRGA